MKKELDRGMGSVGESSNLDLAAWGSKATLFNDELNKEMVLLGQAPRILRS